jgi:hypothetical protein
MLEALEKGADVEFQGMSDFANTKPPKNKAKRFSQPSRNALNTTASSSASSSFASSLPPPPPQQQQQQQQQQPQQQQQQQRTLHPAVKLHGKASPLHHAGTLTNADVC